MIKTIIFDFGNVVCFFDHQRAIDKLKPFTPLSSQEIRRRVYEGALEDDYEKGRMTTEEFAKHVIELCEIAVTPEQYLAAFTDIFTENPDVIDLLPKLKPKYRVLLASNTNDAHFEHFTKQFAPHFRHFDFLGASHHAGARKPTTPFYEHIHKAAECEKGECLFFDDLPANVEAARAFGWQAEVYPKGTRMRDLMASRGIQV